VIGTPSTGVIGNKRGGLEVAVYTTDDMQIASAVGDLLGSASERVESPGVSRA
jgi:hypothetical protein